VSLTGIYGQDKGLLSRMERYLEANEKVLWTGRPVRKAFVLSTWASIPSGLVFLGISIIFLWVASAGGVLDYSVLFVLLFVLIGALTTFGPTAWQFLRYRNTEYMITDRRLITQTGVVGLDTRFVDLDRIQEVYVRIGLFDKVLGTGNLYAMTAGYSAYVSSDGAGSFRPSLRALREPYNVQKLLQGAMERAR
jgi:uncharacterized membrane protein YdbT with pleckstrin-like domain